MDYFQHCSELHGSTSIDPMDGVGAPVASLQEVFNAMSRPELRRRQDRLNAAVAELGLQAESVRPRVKRRTSPLQADWQLDLYPNTIPADEWSFIERSVLQRASALNAYLKDIYGEQNILREKVIPFDIVLRDPAYHRQMVSLQPNDGVACKFGAFDLIRTSEGQWQVADHHLGTPFGLSFVLQNRRILSQVVPELFADGTVPPVASFTTRLTELLRAQSSAINPHVVLLTRGDLRQAFFEAGFLARQMGISIAQPRDLLVRDSFVYLKTIRGLERIDVIYRRVDSASVDPIAIPANRMAGIPGLANVVRKGNVAIVNALGSGVADNRAILRYMDRIVSYYTGQVASLKTVRSFNLADPDQRQHVAESADDYFLKPTQDHDYFWLTCGRDRAPESEAELGRVAKQHPEHFVAQLREELPGLPTFRKNEFHPTPYFLRVYFMLGERPCVLPGGLTQAMNRTTGGRGRRLSLRSQKIKDTFVTIPQTEDRSRHTHGVAQGLRHSISSRVAESLYWMGRYIERAENTSRQFNILENLRWDQLGRTEQKLYWPLLRAIASAADHTSFAKLRHPPRDTLKFSSELLLDGTRTASVHACLLSARQNLGPIRDTVSPEYQQALEELYRFVAESSAANRPNRTRLLDVSRRVVADVARLNGLAERTMVHDDGFQFYHIGVYIERAAGTLDVLKNALPEAILSFRNASEENADLTALLRLFASLDAYRREYRTRAYLDRVTRLLLVSANNPSSVQFCLHKLAYGLSTVVDDRKSQVSQHVQGQTRRLIEQLDNLPITQLLPSAVDSLDAGESTQTPSVKTAERLGALLEELSKQIGALHKTIDESFFSHQLIYEQEPDLFAAVPFAK